MTGTLQVPTSGAGVSGSAFAGDVNGMAAALANMSQGATAPTIASTGLTSIAGLWWHNTSTGVIAVCNQAQTAWVPIGMVDETNGVFVLSAEVVVASGGSGEQTLAAIAALANGAATSAALAAVSATSSAALPKAGGTMTGALILAADPTASLGAATKHYVDNAAPSLFSAVHDVTGSRTAGTTYTNSTGKPMFVIIIGSADWATGAATLSVGGVAVAAISLSGSGGSVGGPMCAVVPPGATYLAYAFDGLSGWVEIY